MIGVFPLKTRSLRGVADVARKFLYGFVPPNMKLNLSTNGRPVIVSLLVFATLTCCCTSCFKPRFVHVTGRVTYGDGAPLTRGQICFTDGYYLGRGDLDENGEYSLRMFRKNDGIPRGSYQVYITSALRFEIDDSVTKTDVDNDDEDRYRVLRTGRVAKVVEMIDRQYTHPLTSGWSVEVKKKSSFDFVVYPPGQVPEDEITEEARFQFDKKYRAKKVKEYWKNKAEEEGDGENAESGPPKPRLVNPSLL